MPRSAAIYCRISLDRTGDELGVGRQEADCRALAERKGWPVAEVYIDNDVSASKRTIRPAYKQLLADIRDGHRDAVIVWDLDRLTRRPMELEQFVETCERAGLRDLATIGDNVDLGTGNGLLVARIKGAVAAEEARKIGDRVRRKKLEMAEHGLPPGGGMRAYGYADDKITVIESEAQVLRAAAAAILGGETYRSVCIRLNRDGIPALNGRWDTTKLRRLLVSHRTAGLRAYKGQVVGPAAWPAILDMDTHESLRRLHLERTQSAPRTALLSGLAFCGRCGSRMYRVMQRNDRADYACLARRGGCGANAIALPAADAEVERHVNAWLSDPALLADLRHERSAATSDDRVLELDGRIAAEDARLAGFARMLGSHEIELAEWKELRSQVKANLVDLREQRSVLAGARRRGRRSSDDPLGEWRSGTVAARNAFLRTIMDGVVIVPAGGRGVRMAATERVKVEPPS